MKTNSRSKMIAEKIKHQRIELGITQKDLAENTNISLRSIQRIENAQVNPRAHTLKVLSQHLKIDLIGDLHEAAHPQNNKPYKLILSIGGSLLIAFLFAAFLLQHPRFPETFFEASIAWSFLIVLLTVANLWLWKEKSEGC